ncbi:hypothetical protein BC567DRAFT_231794 [Phyllosticta citribraziliensis]
MQTPGQSRGRRGSRRRSHRVGAVCSRGGRQERVAAQRPRLKQCRAAEAVAGDGSARMDGRPGAHQEVKKRKKNEGETSQTKVRCGAVRSSCGLFSASRSGSGWLPPGCLAICSSRLLLNQRIQVSGTRGLCVLTACLFSIHVPMPKTVHTCLLEFLLGPSQWQFFLLAGRA